MPERLLCCEPCADAANGGVGYDDSLSLLPVGKVAVIGNSIIRPGLTTCELCGYAGELDVAFTFHFQESE